MSILFGPSVLWLFREGMMADFCQSSYQTILKLKYTTTQDTFCQSSYRTILTFSELLSNNTKHIFQGWYHTIQLEGVTIK